ncbi:hypothetical protein LDENG_00155130 [Lucifuga dentata]|nr:hypothetical protein LDENG_00155130 [Lucifuga dentata]
MQRTFALRCEEIVNSSPPIAELKDRWPALFCEAQHTPQLLKLYKKRKTGRFIDKMAEVLMAYEEQDKNDISAARITALAGLPLYLKEDSSGVFRICEDESEGFHEGAVALVAVVNEDDVPGGIPFETHHVSIILEDQVVMTHRSWTDALVVLFGLICVLHLSYPEKLSSFFEFFQVALLSLDDGRNELV